MQRRGGKRQQLQQGAEERLLAALAEHIKLPLLQIARRSELARTSDQQQTHLEAIQLTADTALQLLDNYLLSTQLAHMPELELEPVSVASVLTETAHQLARLAERYQCELEVHLSGRYEPVLVHRAGLQAALTSLGYVFIESQPAPVNGKRPVLKLAAHRGKTGIVAGIFTGVEGMSSDMYRRGHQLYGRARQTLPELTAGNGAGVFVADALLTSMSAHLRVARHQSLTGLAATLAPSHQLELI